jgi:hypothetical protein
MLGMTLTAPVEDIGHEFPVGALVSQPVLRSMPDPAFVETLAQAAIAYARRAFDMPIPLDVIPEIERYVASQLQNVKERGVDTWVVGLGTQVEIYSLTHLLYDAAQYAKVQGEQP